MIRHSEDRFADCAQVQVDRQVVPRGAAELLHGRVVREDDAGGERRLQRVAREQRGEELQGAVTLVGFFPRRTRPGVAAGRRGSRCAWREGRGVERGAGVWVGGRVHLSAPRVAFLERSMNMGKKSRKYFLDTQMTKQNTPTTVPERDRLAKRVAGVG